MRRVIRAVDLYSRKLIAQHGLSSPQLLCLRRLAEQGPLPTGSLAKAVSLSPATVSGILDRLESRGLVLRERQIEDKRRVVVRLTAAGEAAARQAPPSLQENFLFKLRALPANRQVEIDRTLKQIVAMMSAEDLDAAPILSSGDTFDAGAGRRGNPTRER